MVYMGSKSRIVDFILPIILRDRKVNQFYVEPFAGGMNTICNVDGNRIASDINLYLISLWKAIQQDVDFPTNITEQMYKFYRDEFKKNSIKDAHLIGWVGFVASYRGRMFEGYSGNYKGRDFIKEYIANIKKQAPKMRDVQLYCCSYDSLKIPNNSIIYCDPPYRNTTKYKTESFDYEKFYDWCRSMKSLGHNIFVSEYNMPNDFKEIWSKQVKTTLTRNKFNATEKLFTL